MLSGIGEMKPTCKQCIHGWETRCEFKYCLYPDYTENYPVFKLAEPEEETVSLDEKSTYYDAGGIETMNIIEAKLTPEQFKGYLLGNIIKYSCRANFKGQGKRDMEKVGIYSGILWGEMGEDSA